MAGARTPFTVGSGSDTDLDHDFDLDLDLDLDHDGLVDVVVEVAEWEQERCGPAIERGMDIVLSCVRRSDVDGREQLVETHHTDAIDVQISGRVTDLAVVHADGRIEAIYRLPGGEALRGFDAADDGHLERAWTGRRVHRSGGPFLVTISTDRPSRRE